MKTLLAKESGDPVSRNDVFITTKVWVDNNTRTRFERSVDVSLKALHTDYIDLLLLHWPSAIVSA